MVYWTSSDGIILRAESRHGDLVGNNDAAFAAPFVVNPIIGRNLFQFIDGIDVIHLYRALTERILRTGQTISFDYRCDGPGARREMSMKLSRDGPTVRYDSVLLRETLRAREIRGATPNAPALVALCSFCQNYRFPVASKMWKEIEHLFNEADLSPEFTFTHGICDTCFARVMNA